MGKMRIDAHQHFWDLDKFSYPWLKSTNQILYQNYLPSDLAPLLDENYIVGTIAVQASPSEAETEWLLSLAQAGEKSFIKGVVGWADLMAPDISERLDRLAEQGPLSGLRHPVQDEQDNDWLLRPAVIRGLKAVAARGLAYDLQIRPLHFKALAELFKEVPDAVWVIEHLAKPHIREGKMEGWLEGIKQAAAHPNVYCKLSGMITEADYQNWTAEDIRPYFEVVVEAFKPERLLMGSDWPVCLMAGEYSEVCNLVAELVDLFSETEQEQIWSRNAAKVYRFSLD